LEVLAPLLQSPSSALRFHSASDLLNDGIWFHLLLGGEGRDEGERSVN
jgi:hypothetical protein